MGLYQVETFINEVVLDMNKFESGEDILGRYEILNVLK